MGKLYENVSESGIKETIYEDVDHDTGIITRTNKMSISDKDAAIIMDEARYKSLTTGGWSKSRNSRQMGSMLLSDFLALKDRASAEGRELSRRDFEGYFATKNALKIANNSKSGLQVR